MNPGTIRPQLYGGMFQTDMAMFNFYKPNISRDFAVIPLDHHRDMVLSCFFLVGGFNPSEKLVSWDDYDQLLGKINKSKAPSR